MSDQVWEARITEWRHLNGTPPRLDKLPPIGARGTVVRWIEDGENTYAVDFGPPWGVLEVQPGEARIRTAGGNDRE